MGGCGYCGGCGSGGAQKHPSAWQQHPSAVCSRLQGNRRRESGLAQLTFDLITDLMASRRRTPARFIIRVLQPHLPAAAAARPGASVGISQMV